MKKRLFAGLLLAMMLILSIVPCYAAEEQDVFVAKNAEYKDKTISFVLANNSLKEEYVDAALLVYDVEKVQIVANGENIGHYGEGLTIVVVEKSIAAGSECLIKFDAEIKDYDKKNLPEVKLLIASKPISNNLDLSAEGLEESGYVEYTIDNIFAESATPGEAVVNFLGQTGFSMIAQNWKVLVMILISCILMYLAIVKKFEPLLLLPIAFGMLLTNLPGAGMFHEELYADGHVHWELFAASNSFTPGLLDYLYLGVKLGIYPCLIFLGVGAMTDFGPLIANPKSLLLGAAAQLGIFITYIVMNLFFGFTPAEAR